MPTSSYSTIKVGFDASQVAYNNTVSGLAAANVQNAIDELVGFGGVPPAQLVANFAALPPAASVPGQFRYVVAPSGSYLLFTKKNRGWYRSDGVDWNYGGDNTRLASDEFYTDTFGISQNNVQGAIDVTLNSVLAILSTFNENAQDAVGNILVDTSEIDLTYNDGTPSITAALVTTTVVTGSYGSASQVPTYTVDTKGRLTAAANVAISILSTAITDFNEAAQDAVGTILVDSSEIDFTYNDATPSITAALVNTAVSAGSFGSSTSIPSFTVDAKGRLTAAAGNAPGPINMLSDVDHGSPSAGQALIWNNSGAVWTNGNPTIPSATATATANHGVTSATYVQINNMSFTLAAGTWIVFFSAQVAGTEAGQNMEFALANAGVTIAHSERDLDFNLLVTGGVPTFVAQTQAIVLLDAGSATITAIARTATGTMNIGPRSMYALKLL